MRLSTLGVAGGMVSLFTLAWFATAAAPLAKDFAGADKQFSDGNVKDAFDSYRALLLQSDYSGDGVEQHVSNAVNCLERLNRTADRDDFLEALVDAHPKNHRILTTVADQYAHGRHDGFIVAGKFERGNHRGGGEYADASDRDQVRALQLYVQAMPAADDEKPEVRGSFYVRFARAILGMQGYGEAWKLQALTDLSKLPDYERGGRYYRGYGDNVGAPVDADGNPVFYAVPASFVTAKSDGERWRWALAEAAKAHASFAGSAKRMYAEFLLSQFGTQTMAAYGAWFRSDDDADRPQTFALDTLKDEETIARLATGVKRFTLPDEHSPIKIYRQLVADAARPEVQDCRQLAEIYQNRRQFDRAAQWWRRAIELAPRAARSHDRQMLAQIVDNWGRFEGTSVAPAGRGAELEYRFRNGKSVSFTAHKLKYDKLLDDIKAYLKAGGSRIDWQRIDIGNIGYRIVEQNQKQYVGEQVAEWKLELEPRPRHFDRRITITTPLEKAGAYLVTAQMADGNVSRVIVWLADTVIAKKPLDGKTWVYVADAVSGTPIPRANVEFFGYRMKQTEIPIFGVRYSIETTDFAELTDADGQIRHDFKDDDQQFSWLSIARTDDGRLAHLGFASMWHGNHYEHEYNETKVYGITDRPVYRPAQKVEFKFWLRQAKYDLKEENDRFADRSYNVELHDPQGTKVWEKELRSDSYGGIAGSYELPSDAKLGVYQLFVVGHGGMSFRVEEYKKPEFEVTVDVPDEPVKLGDKVSAEIVAKYYFGAPVVEAKVKYKVLRTRHDARWYPVGRWDWLYGRGYWWFAYDYAWLPGWSRWGCLRPVSWWWPQSYEPPEVVAEMETEIGSDGKLQFEIDTALAKAMHGDQDHRYEVTAEVVDQSRRTIVGRGQVLVARAPFKVFAWVDRGHYRVGDTVTASFSAHTLADKPVKGAGKLKLLKLSYDANRQAVETPVEEWNLDTDADGRASQQLTAGAAGQYRLSYELTDAKGNKQEGGYVFTVMGDGDGDGDYRFAAIELVPDKREYAPGDKVRLQINADRRDSTVMLFVRPANGVYLPPRVVKIAGKSTTIDIDVALKDMPNFFVEALTIADGKLHVDAKDIVVPPASRVVDVAVKPSQTEYKPGQQAEIELKLVGPDGKAFVGQTVVAVYDKAVEYISGGSNVPAIKEFFWKWRRPHHPQTESSLDLYFGIIMKSGETPMSDVGVFGGGVADEEAGAFGAMGNDASDKRGDFNARGGRALRFGATAAAAPAAPARMMAKASADAAPAEAAGAAGATAEGSPEVAPTVRSNFADTALWIAALETNSDGIATAKLTMPENLTTWKIRTWAMGAGTNVGEGSVDVVTTKKLLVRLQAPRFFTETDEVVLSANVHNYLSTKKSVRVVLELDGKTLTPLDDASRTVEVEAEGETRVDWRVRVAREGEAVIRMKALTDEESDAVEMKFPVYVHGMLKTESFAGTVRPDRTSAQITFDVPEARRIESSRLEVRYSPTLAGAMVDALPYLANYPYGCTEQTLSRFLPAAITQKVLREMGLDLKQIQAKRTNLNAQEIGDAQERAEQWKRYDRNPVFDEAELTKMVKAGVRRLTDMQCSDGGWGWFSGYGERSYAHTTAYVVHGFQIAKRNDVALVPGTLERGVDWLANYQAEQVRLLKNWDRKGKIEKKQQADNLDAFVFMVLADADRRDDDMLRFLERDRPKLSVYGLCLYGMALHKLGEADKLAAVMTNLSQYVVEDAENETAYLNLPGDNYWWYWYGSENEAMAYYLKLLAAVEPQGRVAPRLVKYLLNNRKHGTYWKSTRDTALCVEAFADYLKASGEAKPNLAIEVWLDGTKRKEVKIDADNLFSFDNAFVLEGEALTAGRHTLELRKSGTGAVYFNAYQTNFTKEPFITAAGLEVKVERKFYKLNRVEASALSAGSRGQALGQKIEKYERQELPNLSEVTSGDLIEIEMAVESKNDYEYVILEDMKAAGCEPVEVRSGYDGNSLGAYVEYRDERVCLFLRTLPRGRHSVSYKVRAEIPGTFSALPTKASAMYAPELRGNSDEMKLVIEDK